MVFVLVISLLPLKRDSSSAENGAICDNVLTRRANIGCHQFSISWRSRPPYFYRIAFSSSLESIFWWRSASGSRNFDKNKKLKSAEHG